MKLPSTGEMIWFTSETGAAEATMIEMDYNLMRTIGASTPLGPVISKMDYFRLISRSISFHRRLFRTGPPTWSSQLLSIIIKSAQRLGIGDVDRN